MTTTRPIAYVALEAIERSIRDLSRPTGVSTTFDVYGQHDEEEYRIGQRPKPGDPHFGKPHRMWPGVLEVTEALVGSAFAVAQAHVRAKTPRPPRADDVETIANYWKHRDEWGRPWSNGPEDPTTGMPKRTVDAVIKLGAAPPVAVGQLTTMVEIVLGRSFGAEALWALLE